MTKRTYLPLAALLLSGTAMPAFAQAIETPQQDQSTSPTTPEAANDGTNDIVVTANRREQNLQDVSGVVQAFSSDDLRKSGITELRNLAVAVPGLNIANQEGNVEIFIRGVGSSNNTELGDPGAAPHLNGSYIPRPRGLGLMFYDLERVEVNKGPQGTLYGRNALAGTLNIITAKPTFDRITGYAQAEYGNRDSYAAEGAINVPLGSNFAARVAGYYINRDYGFTNASPDPQASKLKPAGLEENYAGRLSLRWEPTDRLSVSVVGDYGKETGTGYPGANIYAAVQATGLRPEQLDLRKVVYRGQQGDMENELWGVQGKIGYSFDTFSVEATGSYRSVDFMQANASSESIAWNGRDYSTVQFDNFSNNFWQTRSQSQVYELRASADSTEALRWNLGGFYFKEKQQVGYLAVADRGYCCYSGTEFTMPDVDGESFAFFADATYDVTDRLRVIGGIRYTEEKKSRFGIGGNWALTLGGNNGDCCVATRLGTEGFRPALLDRPNFNVAGLTSPQQRAQFLIEGIKSAGARDTLIQQIGSIANGTNPNGTCFTRPDIDNGFVTCPANGSFSYANLTIPGQQVGSAKFDFIDYRAGLEFDVTPDNMLYAKVSTGHKSGGFNDTFQTSPIPEAFKPESLTVFEAGSRNTFDGYSLVNRNIGASRIYGVEAEARFQLPGNFSLDTNVAYLDTKITRGSVADARGQNNETGESPLIDLTGNRLPLASKFNVSVKLAQWFEIGRGRLDWQALLNYRSSFFLSQFNEDDIVFLDGSRQNALQAGFPDRQQGYTTLNLGIGYTLGNYRLEAWASNFTDQQASTKALVGSALNIRFLNDARTYGLRARVNF